MGKEIWNYIDSGFSSPFYNMALDEALLDWHSEGKSLRRFVFTDGIRRHYPSAIFKRLKKKLIWML